ncbi:HSP20 family protein [Halarchaeum rubridurum]|uniref:HSP20 family protein n=1 Tax=Halarchaeum rubridurum TaxID=489911 RepID=A0A830FYL6_9EURY|nr:Hsp20/alpha crystallin family protein [Halarchaeum rubridurum]MBP1954532.1 HSP20 family protein [Halarchaeum rubridurum]GGM61877.1 heat-shock protein Hsp20 [Halarchaeum rubridurum]
MPRRNPFDDIDRLFDRLNRQFEDAAEMLDDERGDALTGGFAADVEDAGDEFVVTVDLPGFEKEDVDVRVQDRALSISAERTTETETGGDEAESTYVRRERHGESVSRRLTLPEPVDTDDVAATMKNGVLTVTLGKEDESDGHRIDVQ